MPVLSSLRQSTRAEWHPVGVLPLSAFRPRRARCRVQWLSPAVTHTRTPPPRPRRARLRDY
eukprot:scaffold1018_cov420-Prasinococcus_capsulatus_cf.AAC.17